MKLKQTPFPGLRTPLAVLLLIAAAPLPPPVRPAAVPSVAAVFTAERAVTLRPGADGQVVAVDVAEGARVRAGATLVRLDDRQQRARVALAARAAASGSEAGAAEIRSREAAERLKGTTAAATSGAATGWELRQAHAAAAQAAMDAVTARDRQAVEGKRLDLERLELDNYVVRTPFAGRVTRLGARPGMTVRKTDAVATVVDLGTLRGDAFVPVANYPRLIAGASYPVSFAAPFNTTARATLAYIDPVIDAGLVRCVFRLANTGEALPSGLQGIIKLAPNAR